MAKPPVDTDPERFIIGRGVYSNLQVARPYYDERVFRIEPAPMPVQSIALCNLFFAVIFAGFGWAIHHLTHGQAGAWLSYGASLSIGLLTCLVFTALAYSSFDEPRRLGPWLVYDKATGEVNLPREGVRFRRHEIVHLQYITTKRLQFARVTNNSRLSELNLITCRDGVRQRWPLLRSVFTDKAFDRILHPLTRETDLPVVRVQDEWLGWNTTETPYGGTVGS
jgi:hypothetical protein